MEMIDKLGISKNRKRSKSEIQEAFKNENVSNLFESSGRLDKELGGFSGGLLDLRRFTGRD